MAQFLLRSLMAITALSFGVPAAAQTSAPDAAFVAARDGTLVHSASGLRFPEAAAGFRRAGNAVFDAKGEYVGVRYVKPLGAGARMELRMAVVHINQMAPKEHYIIMKPRALQGLSGVRTVAEGPYDRAGNTQGYRGIFTAVRNGRRSMVGLWAFERGYWDLRARAEFPTAHRVQAEKAVGDFVSELGDLNRGSQATRP